MQGLEINIQLPDLWQQQAVRALSDGGDGCDAKLNWWVTGYIEQLKNPPKPDPNAPRRRGPRDYTVAELPAQCKNVLSSR